jgi:hypothetical protein
MHGLVRGENMELGRDSDTGGQVIMPYIASWLRARIKNLTVQTLPK